MKLTEKSIAQRLKRLRHASADIRSANSERRNRVLRSLAELISERRGKVLAANAADLGKLHPSASSAFRDRLTLDPSRLTAMQESLKAVAALADPLEQEAERRTLSNGLVLRRVRAPLGVIFMIFESRPNVAVESFSLGFKAGNALILRAGREALQTTSVFYALIEEALAVHGFDRNCVWGITDPDRGLVRRLLKQTQWIDVVIPRGGDSLIEFVARTSEIPIIKNDRGLCHVYVHDDADAEMALRIVENAKCQRPGVCNAMETVLVNERRAAEILPRLHERLAPYGVEWYACPKTFGLLKGRSKVRRAVAKNWDTEYLDFKMNCRVVGSLDEAIQHIEEHGSRHSEAIVTKSAQAARRFQDQVDAAAVYWNASTRFTDGFEFGLGGEIGISTQKLHVRGPVGLRELTSTRWIGDGSGQVRK